MENDCKCRQILGSKYVQSDKIMYYFIIFRGQETICGARWFFHIKWYVYLCDWFLLPPKN